MVIGARIHDLVRNTQADLTYVLKDSQVRAVQLTLPKFVEGGEPIDGFSIGQLQEIKKVFDEANIGVRVLSCYINPLADNIEQEQAKFRRFVDYAVEMKVPIVGTETGTIVSDLKEFQKNHTEEVFDTLINNLHPLVVYAKERGILVGVESVAYFPVYDEKRFERLKKSCPENSMCCIFDPTNLLHSGNYEKQHEVFENFLRMHARDIQIVHLKDFVYQDNWLNEVPLFEGLLDVEYLFKLLKSYNVQADMIVENAPSIQGFKLIKEKLEKIINRGI